jgi:Flp pilus assembly protein TadG
MLRPAMRRDDSGATAVELALALPVFLAFVLFTLYAGLYLYYAAVAEHVARDAVRDAAIPMTGTSDYPPVSEVQDRATHVGGALIPTPTSVDIASDPAGAAPREGDEVTVTVTYDLPAVAAVANAMWFLPSAPTSVTRSASARRE